MRNRRRPRKLTVDATTTYWWTVRHHHTDGTDCREVLTLRRDDVRTRIVFRDGPGRALAGGTLHTGGVVSGDHYLNLHEPGTVRALVDEALRRGPLPPGGELDGWELLPAAAVSRRRSR
ncbi:hypothetical protein [Streptomyces sp. A012304]|uniref:hypothetical protein n=1 Tax=Streptomyces sp. A012304 TaxID=375446 RepID=UPI002230729E|nr:hypothetical protein [Streptomyces sp. A012304]GKQ37150.1 hypothetical protein ALMP_36890 [Streptomyces sp. A012304]